MRLNSILLQLKGNRLFRDSSWAILGNGFGNLLIMISGILIARYLGKDLYGDYGMVKTSMFYLASFSCFGMGVTSTKYVSQAISKNVNHLNAIVRDTLIISFTFSFFVSLLIFIFSDSLAVFLGNPDYAYSFRLLSLIIVFRSLTTAQIGILSGMKKFKESAINSLLSGFFLVVVCVPAAHYYSIKGALFALLLSQLFNFVINFILLRKSLHDIDDQDNKSYISIMLKQSLPIALQESSIPISNWLCILFLTSYSNSGEVGLYTAAAQWNAVISMVPVLLSNVILSYITGSIGDKKQHNDLLKKMVLINFSTTFIPFIVVFLLADYIASFYGPSFTALGALLRVYTLITVIDSCTNIFKSEFISLDKSWLFFVLRLVRDIVLIVLAYYLLTKGQGSGALLLSEACVIASFLFLVMQIVAFSRVSSNLISLKK